MFFTIKNSFKNFKKEPLNHKKQRTKPETQFDIT